MSLISIGGFIGVRASRRVYGSRSLFCPRQRAKSDAQEPAEKAYAKACYQQKHDPHIFRWNRQEANGWQRQETGNQKQNFCPRKCEMRLLALIFHCLRPAAPEGGLQVGPGRQRKPVVICAQSECAAHRVNLHAARIVAGIKNGQRAVSRKRRRRRTLTGEEPMAGFTFQQNCVV